MSRFARIFTKFNFIRHGEKINLSVKPNPDKLETSRLLIFCLSGNSKLEIRNSKQILNPNVSMIKTTSEFNVFQVMF